MKNNGNKKDNVPQEKNENSSDKKSFQLVFWLLAAKIGFILILAGLAFWLIYSVHSSASRDQAAVRFGKVHGSGFTESGDRLWIASNSGIISYHNGSWKKEAMTNRSAGTQNLPVKDGYLQISENGMAAERSYDGHLIRSIPFSKKFAGGLWGTDDSAQTFYNLKSDVGKLLLSYSTDGGKNWSSDDLKGIKGKILMLAVHPEKADTFAIATTKGLFVTQDGGAHFQSYLNGKSVSSVSFAGGSDVSLLAGTYGNDTALYNILPAHQKTINLEMDTVEGDRLVQISQSLVNKQEAAVLTESGDVYLTRNGGQNWVIIAQKGRGLSGA
ncbi:group-specific protein [Sporolactobacillus pectinivorans]|uniref:group-specific protein n=1 Tax=Sporolactobacillus pectinivorans TaxID=1591408 RepID=UPI000C267B7F|nr:group-specific protein [Sporolactobacillus pectinivorans]